MADTESIPWHRVLVACLIGSTAASGVAFMGILGNYFSLFAFDEALDLGSIPADLTPIVFVGFVVALMIAWAIGLLVGFPVAMIAIGRGWDSWVHALLLGGAITFVPAIFYGLGKDPLLLGFVTLVGIVCGLTIRRFALGSWA